MLAESPQYFINKWPTIQKSGGYKSRENSDRQGLGDGEGYWSKGTKDQRCRKNTFYKSQIQHGNGNECYQY